MYKFKKNLFPMILLFLLALSAVTLFLVSTPVQDVSGIIVSQSEMEAALQDASQTMLVLCIVVGLCYMHSSAVAKQVRKPKKAAPTKERQVERHVSYMGIKV
jgi:hypothetical protein